MQKLSQVGRDAAPCVGSLRGARPRRRPSTGSITGAVKDEQGAVLPGVDRHADRPPAAADARSPTPQAYYRFPALEPGTYESSARALRVPRRRDRRSGDLRRQRAGDRPHHEGRRTHRTTSPSPANRRSSTSRAAPRETTISQDLLFSAPITPHGDQRAQLRARHQQQLGLRRRRRRRQRAAHRRRRHARPERRHGVDLLQLQHHRGIQFQGLGATAEYGGFTGAVVNTITKSGGNRFSGLFDVFAYQQRASAATTCRRDRRAKNPTLADPAKSTKFVGRHDPVRRADQAEQAVLSSRARSDSCSRRIRAARVTRRHEVSPRLERQDDVAALAQRQLHRPLSVRRLQHHRPRRRVARSRDRRR